MHHWCVCVCVGSFWSYIELTEVSGPRFNAPLVCVCVLVAPGHT